jgi:hypothetical protein
VVVSVLLTQTDQSLYSDVNRAEGSSLPNLQELQSPVWYLIAAILVGVGIAAALALLVLTIGIYPVASTFRQALWAHQSTSAPQEILTSVAVRVRA